MAASLIAPIASSLIVPIASLLINATTGKGVMRARKWKEGEILSLLALILMMKVLENGIKRDGRGCNNMDKHF